MYMLIKLQYFNCVKVILLIVKVKSSFENQQKQPSEVFSEKGCP